MDLIRSELKLFIKKGTIFQTKSWAIRTLSKRNWQSKSYNGNIFMKNCYDEIYLRKVNLE